MKVCRFTFDSDAPKYGVLEREIIKPFREADIFGGSLQPSGEELSAGDVKFLAPVLPSKIVCVGRNYAEHARELGNEIPAEPLLFLKASSSLIIHGEEIVLPAQSNQVEHEGELGVVIGRRAKNLSDDDEPLEYVFGYLCLNDVTARDLQRRDVQFTRAKSFDTFCPIGAMIETELDPTNLAVVVRVNNVVKQMGNTAQMVFPVPDLIRYISRQMTLQPGDIIATGTPSGVSKLSAGDTVEVEIEKIGVLRNSVRQ